MIGGVLGDVRFALRDWKRRPAYPLLSIATLAIGIGAAITVFSAVEAVLLRPLPYAAPDRLVAIWDSHRTSPDLSKIFVSFDDFDAWRRGASNLDAIAAATWAMPQPILSGRGTARTVVAVPVTVDFFRLLGVAPERGRTFGPSDAERGCVVVVAHRFWTGTLESDATIPGRSLDLDNQACTVVGVMPARFAFYPEQTDVWRLIDVNRNPLPRTGYQGVGVFARLKPGVTLQQAQAEISALHRRAHEHDQHGLAFAPTTNPLQQEFTWLAGHNLRVTLWLLFAAVAVVLFLACVNVATLLLGRGIRRSREFAIRAALGSSRWHIGRLVLIESAALAAGGTVVGTAGAALAIRLLRNAAPIELPPGTSVDLDWRVGGFAIGVTALTAAFFGALPAWRASRANVVDGLKSWSQALGGSRLGRRNAAAFVVAEIASAMVLLAVAALMVESIDRLASAPLGFNPDGLAAMTITLPRATYGADAARVRFFDRLLPALSEPGATRSAAVSRVFLRARTNGVLLIEGRPDPSPDRTPPDVTLDSVSPAYFDVVGVPLLAGRAFDDRDRAESPPVSIVNAALARKYFPNEDPIGKRIRTPLTPWTTIVGIVGDQKTTNAFQEMAWFDPIFMYRPYAQDPPSAATLVTRTRSDAGAAAATVQRVLAAIDPDVPVSDAQTVHGWMAKNLAYPQFRAVVLAAFAAVALLLAVVGLYAVLTQIVAQRTYEFGVRMALGATAWDVAAIVALQGGAPAVAGVVLGVAGTIASGRVIASLLYGAHPNDFATLASIAVSVLLVSAIALAMPARRATKVDPLRALRAEPV